MEVDERTFITASTILLFVLVPLGGLYINYMSFFNLTIYLYYTVLISMIVFSMLVLKYLDRKSARFLGKVLAISEIPIILARIAVKDYLRAAMSVIAFYGLWNYGDAMFWLFAQIGGFLIYLIQNIFGLTGKKLIKPKYESE